jgi:hypothetical protein
MYRGPYKEKQKQYPSNVSALGVTSIGITIVPS